MYSYCSYYDYYDYSDYDVISILTGLMSLAVIWVIALLLMALMIVAMWILFKKAGKPGWAAVVPFYDQYTLYEITWGNGWRFLMLLIPIYNIILMILTYIRLAKAFGKDEGYAVGLISCLMCLFPCWPLAARLIMACLAWPVLLRRHRRNGWAINSPATSSRSSPLTSSLSTSSRSRLRLLISSLSSRRIPDSG